MKRRPLPTGESSFAAIREGDWLYVDKTEGLYRLLHAGKYYFLSRPRRFGKSLTVTTLQALFEGRRDLFEGLWIHEHWDWSGVNPVLMLSLNGLDYKNGPLEEALCIELDRIAEKAGLAKPEGASKHKMKNLILHLGQQGKVAVLIDEYDKPINDYLHDTAQANANRETLANLYGVLKDLHVVPHLRFVFITGVSKFSKVTLFSELNNLTDLSQDERAGILLGITQEELERDFAPHIAHLAQKQGMDVDALLRKIRRWYNGYSFDGVGLVYNPHSLLSLFSSGSFKNYWFTTGTTTWLARRLRDEKTDVEGLEGLMVGEEFFDRFEVGRIAPDVLLYQTGYLTIKKVRGRDMSKRYTLGYPNLEVRSSLLNSLFQEYSEKSASEVRGLVWGMQAALEEHDLDTFITLLKGLFAGISNRLLKQYVEQDKIVLWEAYYQTVIYLTLSLLGMEIECEVQTNKGYTDAVAETEQYIYVMEFKVGKAEDALQQIRDKGYHEPHLHKGKPVTLLGIGFDPETRNIGSTVIG